MKILNNMLVKVNKPDIVDGVLTIPNGIEIIADYCLKANENIHLVNCPPTLKKIGNSAFEHSSIEMINLNDGLLAIGDHAFSSTNIRMAYLPDSLEYLGEYAFSNCEFLQEVKFGHHLQKIPNCCFKSTSISYVKLEEGIEAIGDYAFHDLKKLRKIDFCSSLKRIEESAFKYLYLDNIYLPSSLNYIGKNFISIDRIKNISCADANTFSLFAETQLDRYYDQESPDKSSFFLNIKSLTELSNGVYGQYHFCCTEDLIDVTSYINKKNKQKQFLIEKLKTPMAYNSWYRVLKNKELKFLRLKTKKLNKIMFLNYVKSFLQKIGLSIEISIQEESVKEVTSIDENQNMKKELGENFHKELPLIQDNLDPLNTGTVSEKVSLKQEYDHIDDQGRIWVNGDVLTPAKQKEIESKGVSLVKKKN